MTPAEALAARLTGGPRPDPVAWEAAALRREHSADMLAFARRCLPVEFYLDVPPAPLHVDLLGLFGDIASRPVHPVREVREGPRGWAKSTYVGKLLPTHIACHPERWPGIKLHAHVRTKMRDAVKDVRGVRTRIESPEIRSVYGDLRKPGGKWNEDHLEFASGYVLIAVGADQANRGLNDPETGRRPDLVDIDDIDKDAQSMGVRDKVRDWLLGAMLGMEGLGRPMHVLMTGTCVDELATTRWLGDQPGFGFASYAAIDALPDEVEGLWVRWGEIYGDGGRESTEAAHAFYLDNREAMDAGATGLWEGDPLETVMRYRLTMGPAKFAAEKLNRPRAGGDRLVSGESLTWFAEPGVVWTPPEGGALYEGERLQPTRAVVVFDPATGQVSGDWHAIVSAWRDHAGRRWAWRADLNRLKEAEVCRRVMVAARDLMERTGLVPEIWWEAVAGFKWCRPMLESARDAAGLPCSIREVAPHKRSKPARLQDLSPALRGARLILGRGMAGEHLDQLLSLPVSGDTKKRSHDDGPDALQIADELLSGAVLRLPVGGAVDRGARKPAPLSTMANGVRSWQGGQGGRGIREGARW